MWGHFYSTLISSDVWRRVLCVVAGFKATDRARLAQKRAQAAHALTNMPHDATQMDTIQLALKTHRCFKTIAIFLLGIFAGIALWHIVSTFLLRRFGDLEFFKHYFVTSLPIHCMYYFLFAIASVHVLDRSVRFIFYVRTVLFEDS